MKWNFFYDENEDHDYKKQEDWYKDIQHLLIPTLVFIIFGVLFLAYLSFA